MLHLSRNPAVVQSFHCNNKLHQHTYPPCWLRKESPSRLSKFSCVLGFLPCYILWPVRTEDQSFWCLDAWKGDWVQLDKCGFLGPVGIDEHFFDAFCYCPQRPWRAAALQALGLPSCHIAEDIHIIMLEESKFSLTPRRIPEERREAASKSRADVVRDAAEQSGSDAESG